MFPAVVVRPRCSAPGSVWARGTVTLRDFLTLLFTCPVCATTVAVSFRVQKTAVFSAVAALGKVVNIPVPVQTPIPMVQPVQQTIEISQLQFDKIIDVPVCASCRFSGALSEETVELPQLQLVEKSLFPDVQVVQFPQTSESLGTARCGVTVHRRSGSSLTG